MTPIAGDVMQKFEKELASLTFAMEQKLPELHLQCKKINDLLRQYPEIAHLLTDEQIGQFMKPVIAESKIQFTMASAATRKGKDPIKNLTKSVNLDSLDDGAVQI